LGKWSLLFHAKDAKEKAEIIDLPKSRVSRPLNPAHNTRASFRGSSNARTLKSLILLWKRKNSNWKVMMIF